MAAVGPWIADEFVLFIERLCDVERLLGTVAEQPVGMPLQFRQIVERWRSGALRRGFERLDRSRSRASPPSDRLRFRGINGEARCVCLVPEPYASIGFL